MAGEGDDGGVPGDRVGLDPVGRLPAVQLRQGQIHDHDVGARRLGLLHGLASVGRGFDPEPGAAEEVGEGVEGIGRVLDQQDQ